MLDVARFAQFASPGVRFTRVSFAWDSLRLAKQTPGETQRAERRAKRTRDLPLSPLSPPHPHPPSVSLTPRPPLLLLLLMVLLSILLGPGLRASDSQGSCPCILLLVVLFTSSPKPFLLNRWQVVPNFTLLLHTVHTSIRARRRSTHLLRSLCWYGNDPGGTALPPHVPDPPDLPAATAGFFYWADLNPQCRDVRGTAHDRQNT